MSKLIRLIFINLGVFAGLILLMVILGELFFEQKSTLRIRHWPATYEVGMEVKFIPGDTIYVTNGINIFQENKVNSMGFPDREYTPLEHTKKIVIVGDSFVQAEQVPVEKRSRSF